MASELGHMPLYSLHGVIEDEDIAIIQCKYMLLTI